MLVTCDSVVRSLVTQFGGDGAVRCALRHQDGNLTLAGGEHIGGRQGDLGCMFRVWWQVANACRMNTARSTALGMVSANRRMTTRASVA